jgi:hypothetical protein
MRPMCNILIKSLMCHNLNHALNVWSKYTRPQRVDGDVSNHIDYVVERIKLIVLHECFK